MLLLVCDSTEVFVIVWKHRFNPGRCLFLRPAFCCLSLRPAFHCLTCLHLALRRSVLSFFVFPLLVLFSLLLVVCGFAGAVEFKLNLWGVDIWVCVCSCAGHVRQVVSALNLAGWWINHKTTFPTLYELFLFVMAHLMSSAQIEIDFGAASLVLPSNRGSMDARFFKLSCVLLWTFSTWWTQRICLLSPCQPKKCAKRYQLMVSACQTCIPKESMMTLTTRDLTVCETYAWYIVLSNKVCLVCLSVMSQCRRIKL